MEEKVDKVEQKMDQVENELRNEMEKQMKTTEKQIETAVDDVEIQVKKMVDSKFDSLKQEFELLKKSKSSASTVKTEDSSITSASSRTTTKIKAPTYDGKTSWSNYLRQFNAAAIANGWDEEEKATSLIISLRGDALDILQSIPEDKQDFKYLCENLERRFGDKYMPPLFRTQFRNRRQSSGESLQQYSADIFRLTRLAFPTVPEDALECLAVDAFADGIRDAELQQMLKLAKPATLNEALAKALDFEAVKSSTRGFVRVRQTSVDEENTRNNCDVLAELQKFIGELMDKNKDPAAATSSSSNTTRRQLKCYNCQKPGHLKRRREPPRQQQDQQNRSRSPENSH